MCKAFQTLELLSHVLAASRRGKLRGGYKQCIAPSDGSPLIHSGPLAYLKKFIYELLLTDFGKHVTLTEFHRLKQALLLKFVYHIQNTTMEFLHQRFTVVFAHKDEP